MERSDALIKFVAILVFAAVMLYIGVSFVSSYRDPLRTVNATGMTLRDGVSTEGYIVRDEEVVTASGANVAATVTEGAKVADGETVAVQYVGSKAMERAQEISEIQLRIRQLTAIKNGKSGDELAAQAIRSLSSAVTSGNLNAVYSVEQDIDAYIISGTALANGDEAERIAELEARLRRLSDDASSDTKRTVAPFSGTFSFEVDGLESVTPDDVLSLDVSNFGPIFTSRRGVDSSALGKLIRGTRWYYCTTVDEEIVKRLRVGGAVNMVFSRTYSASQTMTVRYISQPEDGRCVVTMSADRSMQDVAGVRDVAGEIVFSTKTGISVPREAVHLNEDNNPVVYVLRGVTANEVEINIIAETGDFYMVEDTRTGLRVNDIIIVRARGLYDGAVVER